MYVCNHQATIHINQPRTASSHIHTASSHISPVSPSHIKQPPQSSTASIHSKQPHQPVTSDIQLSATSKHAVTSNQQASRQAATSSSHAQQAASSHIISVSPSKQPYIN
jgi:hypothetical protein